jgi:alpha-L-fucosidase 2
MGKNVRFTELNDTLNAIVQNLLTRRDALAGAAKALMMTYGTGLLTSLEAKDIANPMQVTEIPSNITDQILRYASPAKNWESEALPIGNGRMGAMLFGDIASDEIQFNESSLWGGLNNIDTDLYDTGVSGFGSYLNFGQVSVVHESIAKVSSPSGHNGTGPSEDVSKSIDNNPDTKWCIENPGRLVSWMLDLSSDRKVVNTYSITSANDVPDRDPTTWTLKGSNDNQIWVPLHSKTNYLRFPERRQKQTFIFTNNIAYRYYKIDFTPRTGISHFQLSEITLGGVSIDRPDYTDYRRELNIHQGVHTSTYRRNGVVYTRTAFASRAEDMVVLRYTASSPSRLTGEVSITSKQDPAPDTVGFVGSPTLGLILKFDGQLANNLNYAAGIRVINIGGTASLNGNKISFSKCDTITIYLDARTDYKPSHNDEWRDRTTTPLQKVLNNLQRAGDLDFSTVQREHTIDLSALLKRATLSLGTTASSVSAKFIPERINAYKLTNALPDPELESLLFFYGRYLLVSCSRPGGLPANLQGLWNNKNNPDWASDYHNNINIQMNYWAAENTGLPECHLPLIDFIENALVPLRVATKKAFGKKTRGWTARTSQNIFGGTAWEWNTVASAWYALHLYEHYAFTLDISYLERVYPIIKEICEFWEDRLKIVGGKLMSPMGWSPEQPMNLIPLEDGVMYDQQIIWDLFSNYLTCASVLNRDQAYQKKVRHMQNKLAPNKIGSWGQLQEWQFDRDNAGDTHRHTSHLFAVYPGKQITPASTPEFADAALVSLKARCSDDPSRPFTADTVVGDSRRSWTWPWRAALFARLLDKDRAYEMVRGLTKFNLLKNLFANHPPFQLDGSFGMPAAITEMLIQSHTSEIHLIPALPAAWHTGSFSGLRARGGYVVGCEWSNSNVQKFSIKFAKPGNPAKTVIVRFGMSGSTREVLVSS